MIWGYVLIFTIILTVGLPLICVFIRCYDEYKDRQQEDSSR